MVGFELNYLTARVLGTQALSRSLNNSQISPTGVQLSPREALLISVSRDRSLLTPIQNG